MSSRAYHQKASDSKSLWNYTLSPGWSADAGEVLRKAIMRYGCGNWQKIQKHFPDKTNGQLNLQTQRLFGQQSLAAWNSVHVDPLIIKKMNDAKPDAYRKNNMIINIGNNLTRADKASQKAHNIKHYGLVQDYYLRIKVPTITQNKEDLTLTDNIITLANLYKAYNMIKRKQAKVAASKQKKVDRVFVDNESKDNETSNENNGNKKKATKTKTKNKKSKAKKSGKKSVKKKKRVNLKRKMHPDSNNDNNDEYAPVGGNNNMTNKAPPKKKARIIMYKSETNETDINININDNNNGDIAVVTAISKENGDDDGLNDNTKDNGNDENNSSEIEDNDIDIVMETK